MLEVVSVLLLAAPLTFEAAVEAATRAPDVVALAESVGRREEAVRRAPVLSSNPQLVVTPLVRVDSDFVLPEGQVTLVQPFNLANLAAVQRRALERRTSAARAEVAATGLVRREAVARAWLALWVAERLANAAREETTAASAFAGRLERAVARGGITRAELAQARAFAAEAEAYALMWEGRAVEAGAEVASLLGLVELATAEGPLPALEEPALPVTAEGMGPRLAAARAELETVEARTEENRAASATVLQLSLQGAHEAPTQWLGGVGVGVTFPAFQRGQLEEGELGAAAREATGRIDALTRKQEIELKVAAHELEHSLEVYRAVVERQLPAATEAARLEQVRFERGEATIGELLLVKRQALLALAAAREAEAGVQAARFVAAELAAALRAAR